MKSVRLTLLVLLGWGLLPLTGRAADESQGVPDLAVLHLGGTASAAQPQGLTTAPQGVELLSGLGVVDLGKVPAGATSAVRETFTLTNRGNAPLQSLAAGVEGPGAGNIVLAPLAQATLAPGESAILTLSLNSSASGSLQAMVRISSSDPDESDFWIPLGGTIVPEPEVPEIVVENAAAPGIELLSGGNLDLGGVRTGQTLVHLLTLRNTGRAPLTGVRGLVFSPVGGTASIRIGTPAPAQVVPPGGSTQLRLEVSQLNSGTLEAELLIYSDDADEDRFGLRVLAFAQDPFLNVRLADGSPLFAGVDSSHLGADFAPVSAGEGTSLTLKLRNTGGSPMTVEAVLADNDGGRITLTEPPAGEILPGGMSALTLRYLSDRPAMFSTGVLRLTTNSAQPVLNVNLNAQATTDVPGFAADLPHIIATAGEKIQLPALALGAPELAYTWFKNGVKIPNAAGSALLLDAIKPADVAAYRVEVANDLGGCRSTEGYVMLAATLPGKLSPRPGQTQRINSGLTLPRGCTAKYAWFRTLKSDPTGTRVPLTDGGRIAGARTRSLTLNKVHGDDDGLYACEATVTLPSGKTLVAEIGASELEVGRLPVVNSVVRHTAGLGEDIVLSLDVASDTACRFAATGLPPGVKMDVKTGAISGWSNVPRLVKGVNQPYLVTATITNAHGTLRALVAEITVEPLAEGTAGTYTGLIQGNESPTPWWGTATLVINRNGSWSGKLVLRDQTVPMSGARLEDQAGSLGGRVLIRRRAPETTKLFTWHLAGQGLISGEIGEASVNFPYATLTAWRLHDQPAALAGSYAAGIVRQSSGAGPYQQDPGLFPRGAGFARLTLGRTGAGTWTGRMGDGTAFTAAASLGAGGVVPLHANLYGGSGYVSSFGTLDPGDGTLSATAMWFKLSDGLKARSRISAGGVGPLEVSILGGRYVRPDLRTGGMPLGLPATSTSGNAVLEFSAGGALGETLSQSLTITSKHQVILPPGAVPGTSGARMRVTSFNTATGLFAGTVEVPGPTSALNRSGTFAGLMVPQVGGVGHLLLPALPVMNSNETVKTTALLSSVVELRGVGE